MYLKWKRNSQGIYEGNTMTFDSETGKHVPIYRITRGVCGGWRLTVKGETHIGLNANGHAFTLFQKLDYAKRAAQEIEDENPPYKTDEDEGMAHAHYAPGQEISSYITAERISGRSYVSDDGTAIISETRYPDGRITTERREYGRV